jgi:hypothetical protein
MTGAVLSSARMPSAEKLFGPRKDAPPRTLPDYTPPDADYFVAEDRAGRVLRQQALDNVDLAARVADLTEDRDTCKLMLSVALTLCHNLTLKVRRQSETIREYLNAPGGARPRRTA